MTTTRIRSTVVDVPEELRCKTCGGPVRRVYAGETTQAWYGHLARPVKPHYVTAVPTSRPPASAPSDPLSGVERAGDQGAGA